MFKIIKNFNWIIISSFLCIFLGILTFLTFINAGFIPLTELNLQYLLIIDILVLIIFFSLIFSLNILFSTSSTFSSKIINKYLWIVRSSMVSKEKIDQAMEFAYNAGYNNVFVQVRGRGDAYYNSKIINKYSKIKGDFDPLEYTILLGKSYGI